MKRILFVDDEPNILEGLQDLLRKYRRQMDMVFALGGEAALQELRKNPYDVIVSDMRMPGMDGATLLRKVKQDYPDVIRIILSGHAERNAIFMALPVCHQFLAKPCDAESLGNVIERSCRLRAVLADKKLQKQIGAIERLPSLSKSYTDLMDAIVRPDVSPKNVGEIIEQDSAMSAKLLQLVNSACFGVTKPISRIHQAVVYLGMELVKNLALTVQVFTTLAGPLEKQFKSLQEHSIQAARLAKSLLKDEEQARQAFTAGLLHDVGHIVLATCAPEEYRVVVETSRSANRPLHEVEVELLGFSHASAGAYLLGLWGLPLPIVEAVAYHHDPIDAEDKIPGVTSVTALADTLAKQEVPA